MYPTYVWCRCGAVTLVLGHPAGPYRSRLSRGRQTVRRTTIGR